ncbi:MAG: hypothetical protein RLZZ210_159 [Pseudomonadota bacterium]|jgi:RND family efflux transporter MFP subunit
MKTLQINKIILVLACVFNLTNIYAHGDDDHSHDEKKKPENISILGNSDNVIKNGDGSLFIPKPYQRQINLPTLVMQKDNLSQSIELNANIIADSSSGGKVQPTLAGRVELPKLGILNIGQDVKKGQILAYIIPSSGNIEQSNQKAQLAELNSNYQLTKSRLNRLEQLADTIPKKDIEATKNELVSLNAKINAISSGLIKKEALSSPVSGKIAQVNVISGQVVSAGDTLFEIINPSKMRIEALSFDTNLANNISSAYLLNTNSNINTNNNLQYIGSAGILKEQALPLHFLLSNENINNKQNLVIGQQVKVIIQTKNSIQGFSLPRNAVTKNKSGQESVWLKLAPEIFKSVIVTTQPLDANNIAIITGINNGDRIVISNTHLLNQLR